MSKNPEISPITLLGQTESGHYFDLEQVGPIYERLQRISEADITAAIAMREDGAPQDLITQLFNEPPETDLTHNHLRNSRVNSVAARYHRMGMIVAAMAINNRHFEITGERLRADDPEAYVLARRITAEASYSGSLEGRMLIARASGEPIPHWWMERFRELENTGTDTFSLLTALAYHKAEGLESDNLGPVSKQSDAVEAPIILKMSAFQTGMVDARIFLATYASLHGGKKQLQTFPFTGGERVPISLGDQPFRLTRNDTLETLTNKVRPGQAQIGVYAVRGFVLDARLVTESQVVQIGPDSFARLHEILEVTPAADHPLPRVPQFPDPTEQVKRMIPGLLEADLLEVSSVPEPSWTDSEAAVVHDAAKATRPWRVIAPAPVVMRV